MASLTGVPGDVSVFKAFSNASSNDVAQASTVQLSEYNSLLAVACGPGTDVYLLDSVEEGVVRPKSFSIKYLGQVPHAQNTLGEVWSTAAVKFTAQAGALATAHACFLDGALHIDVGITSIRYNPMHGLPGERGGGVDDEALKIHNVSTGTFFYPDDAGARAPGQPSVYVAAHPSESLVFVTSFPGGGDARIDWLDFSDECLMGTGNNKGSFVTEGFETAIERMEFSPCGEFLVTADRKGLVHVWKYSREMRGTGHAEPCLEVYTTLTSGRLIPGNGANGNMFTPASLSWIILPSAERSQQKEFVLCGSRSGSAAMWELERSYTSGSGVATIEQASAEVLFYPNVHGKCSIDAMTNAMLSDGNFAGERAFVLSFGAVPHEESCLLRFWPFGKSVQNYRSISSSSSPPSTAKLPQASTPGTAKKAKPSIAFGSSTPTKRSVSKESPRQRWDRGLRPFSSPRSPKKKHGAPHSAVAPSVRDVLSSIGIRVPGQSTRGVHVISTPGHTSRLAERLHSVCLQVNPQPHSQNLNVSTSTVLLVLTDHGIAIVNSAIAGGGGEEGYGIGNGDGAAENRPVQQAPRPMESYEKHSQDSYVRRFRLPDIPDPGEPETMGRVERMHGQRLNKLYARVKDVEDQLKDIKTSFTLFTADVSQQMGAILSILQKMPTPKDGESS
jgi:WD40 repeat protein